MKDPPPRPFSELTPRRCTQSMPKLRARVESLTVAEVEALLESAAAAQSSRSSLPEAAAVVVDLPLRGAD